MTRRERLLVLVLRLAGVMSGLAIVAVVMPRAWMAACHDWLGLGALPDGAIVEYLARSLSAFYAMFGGLCILVSFDIRRHAGVVTYLGVTHVAFAAVVLAVDLSAGLPWYWTAAEVPPAMLFGVAILALQAGGRDPTPPAPGPGQKTR